MNSEKQINTLLLQTRKVAEWLYSRKLPKSALYILQSGSDMALQSIAAIPTHKVICSCGRWLRTGKEIEFFRHARQCLSCDSGYQDYLDSERG